MPRRALLWLAGLALVVGALLLTDRLLWQPGLTEDNVRRLRPGMTLAEVEALLGGPAQSRQVVGAPLPRECWGSPQVWERMHIARRWLRGDVSARVAFTLKDRVRDAAFYREKKAGPLARLRGWLGW